MVTPPELDEAPTQAMVWEWQAAAGQAVKIIEQIIMAEAKIPILAFIVSLPTLVFQLLNNRT
jgi:hypothetical protein